MTTIAVIGARFSGTLPTLHLLRRHRAPRRLSGAYIRALRNASAAGPVTMGTVWEMTAVPDIRRQTEKLAEYLAGLVKAAPSRQTLRPAIPRSGPTGTSRQRPKITAGADGNVHAAGETQSSVQI